MKDWAGAGFKVVDNGKLLLGDIRSYPNVMPQITPNLEAMTRTVKDIFDEYLQIISRTQKEAVVSVMNIKNPGEIADLIAANVFVNLEDKMQILEQVNIENRIEKLIVIMQRKWK